MTDDGPPPRIIGYEIGRRPKLAEIPPELRDQASELVVFMGSGGQHYVIPLGVDPLEIGVVATAGDYVLLPIAESGQAIWQHVKELHVTRAQADRQAEILTRFRGACLNALPYDAAEIMAGIEDSTKRGETSALLGILRRAALDVWQRERTAGAPLTPELALHLEAQVGRRAAALMRAGSPRCTLDRASLNGMIADWIGCLWDRILASVAIGDGDDATVRTLARLGRELALPTERLIQVLPGVRSLEVFFALARRSTGDIVSALARWIAGEAWAAQPTGCEQAVRGLYAVWRLELDSDAAREKVRVGLSHITSEPTDLVASRIKAWLTLTSHVSGTHVVTTDDNSRMGEMAAACDAWALAFDMALADVVNTLPEHVS
jgi:hypothetical protein